jgi:hypothetical protein
VPDSGAATCDDDRRAPAEAEGAKAEMMSGNMRFDIMPSSRSDVVISTAATAPENATSRNIRL